MRRYLLVFLVAAACGGKQKSTTPPPPLPEAKAEEKPAEPPAEEKQAQEPPVPQGPIDLTLPQGNVTVKLVSAGKGKKVPLKLASKAGDKQSVELALDFAGKQTLPAELGGTSETINPTMVLLADFETKEVGADGAAKFQMTINGVEGRDVKGAKNTAEEVKEELGTLTGATIQGAVNPNGSTSDLTLHVDKPDKRTVGAVEALGASLIPIWPVLPAEAIGPGAKWTVTRTSKLMGRLDVTQTTDYELVSKKGKAWTVKGTTKVTGTEQEIGDGPQKAKFGGIGGSGTVDATINEGALVPTAKHSVKSDFTATVEAPTQQGAAPQSIPITFHLEQANAVTPKDGAAAAAAPAPASKDKAPASKDKAPASTDKAPATK